MIPAVNVNLVAVVGAAVASMIIGFLWYGPLFGKQWMSLSGMTMAKMKSMKTSMGQAYGAAFIGAIVMAYVLAHILAYAQAATLAEGLMGGAWIWLGFIATKSLGMIIWEGKSVNLYLLNVGHDLVSLLVMSAILVTWV